MPQLASSSQVARSKGAGNIFERGRIADLPVISNEIKILIIAIFQILLCKFAILLKY